MSSQRDIELLAPAGSFESLAAAIQSGANAIYFGVEQLNMRAKSSMNFSLEDMAKIAEICKKHNIKSYITLNTIIYDHDIRLMRSIIDKARHSGIDAVIASDHAVISYARSVNMAVHISTQVNVSNLEAVRFYAAYADVMVLARELSLMQIKHIASGIDKHNITGPSGQKIRLEVFAHGALCMAVSGKCYLSLHTYNGSANRGACVQNCRRTYTVTDKDDGYTFDIDNEYIMSPKDLCTIDFMDRLLDSGVSVLKIEGRGRSPEYVHTVVHSYRAAIDAVRDGSYNNLLVNDWMTQLGTVYNRGFWGGYYLGQELGEWTDTHGSKATKKKVYIGKGLHYYSVLQVGAFLIESQELRRGDNILITGKTTGVLESTAEEIQIDGIPVAHAKKGSTVAIKINARIRPSDKLYKIVNS